MADSRIEGLCNEILRSNEILLKVCTFILNSVEILDKAVNLSILYYFMRLCKSI